MSTKLKLISFLIIFLTGCSVSEDEKQRLAAIACAEMKETLKMQSLERVRILNEVREKIGGEPYLNGDDEIKRSLEWGSCSLLALGASEYEVTTKNREEAHRIAQKKLAEDKERKREAEFQDKESDLRSQASKLYMAYLQKNVSIATENLFSSVSQEVKIKSLSKLFIDEGLNVADATRAASIASLRTEIENNKRDNSLNRYGECADKVIPSHNDMFFTITSRDYKPRDYRLLLELSWNDCDLI